VCESAEKLRRTSAGRPSYFMLAVWCEKKYGCNASLELASSKTHAATVATSERSFGKLAARITDLGRI